MPARGLVLGDMLLAQKIALETMEQEALGVANSQPCLDARPVRASSNWPSRLMTSGNMMQITLRVIAGSIPRACWVRNMSIRSGLRLRGVFARPRCRGRNQ
jgi:hypothetical protein